MPAYRMGAWSALRLQLLFVYERDMEQSDHPLRVETSFQSLILVERGWLEIRTPSGRKLRAKKGEWILLRQGVRYQNFSADCHLISIGFRFQTPTGEAIYEHGLPKVFADADYPELRVEAMRLLHGMEKHVGLGFFPNTPPIRLSDYLAVQELFRDCFLVLARILEKLGVPALEFEVAEDRVARFMELLDRLGPGDRWTVRAVVREMGLSPTHLDRLMVAATGETARQHMDRHRLARTLEALKNESLPIKTIAFQMGFATAAHFSAWFRRMTGMTPLEYRRRGEVWGK